MKRKGPLLTLAAGVVMAAVLMVLNLNATNAANQADSPAAPPTTAPGAGRLETQPATVPATSAPVVPAGPPATYAGPVSGGGGATIAIAVRDGHAVAYLCDGASTEAWLQGTAVGGQLSLTGADNASLTASYANGEAVGDLKTTGRQWSFAVKQVEAPSGLYRASANVTDASVVGGWIVLADGSVVGTQRRGTTITPAPPLNVANKTSVLGGVPVTVTTIDGTKF